MSLVHFDRTWSLPEDAVTTRGRALDVDARHRAFVADGGRDVRVHVDRATDADVVTCTRDIGTGARGVAAALVGTTMTLEQTERWAAPDDDGVVRARLEVTFPGRPLHLDARIEIRPTTTGCDYRVTGVAEARLVGVGGPVARHVVDRMLADLGRHLTAAGSGTLRPRARPAATDDDDRVAG